MRELDQEERGKGRPLASSCGWTTPKCIREPSGYSDPSGMGSGGMWLTERNAPLSARAIHMKPACRRPIGCARGGRLGDPSKCDRKELKP